MNDGQRQVGEKKQPADEHWEEVRCACCQRPHLLYYRKQSRIKLQCRHSRQFHEYEFTPQPQ